MFTDFNKMCYIFYIFVAFLLLLWYYLIILSRKGTNALITRLREIRKALRLNQTNFAKHLGITQTAYSMIEKGNRPLADKYVKIICSEFGISEAWLREGTGNMFALSQNGKEFMSIIESLTPASQEYLLTMARELLGTEQKLMAAGCKHIPNDGE